MTRWLKQVVIQIWLCSALGLSVGTSRFITPYRINSRCLGRSLVVLPCQQEDSVVSVDNEQQVEAVKVMVRGEVDWKQRLSAAGQAGLLAYGLLNFVYYMSATIIVWCLTSNGKTVTDFPSTNKLTSSFKRLAKVSVIVWIGSQATKLFRVAGAVVAAPAVDRLIDWVNGKLRLNSRQKAFWMAIVMLWIGVAGCYATLVLSYAMTLK